MAKDMVRAILRKALEDDVMGEAAKVAFFAFLSLFPLLLAIFALTGLAGGDAAFDWIMGYLQTALPEDAAIFVEAYVQEITGESRPGMLSFGLLLTLWAASTVFAGLTDGLNTAFDVRESRTWWRKRLVALGVLLAASVLLIGGAVALLAGPEIAAAAGLGPAWSLVRWPVAILLVSALLVLMYRALPNRTERNWGAILIGAGVGTALWILATTAFRLYVSNFGNYTQTYGFVGAIMILLLWLYVTAAAILLGGEVTATVARAGERGEPDPSSLSPRPRSASRPARR